MSRLAGIATALALAALATAFDNPAASQTATRTCGPRAEIIQALAGQFEEQTVAVGLSDNGAVIEILTSPDGHTWTLLFSMPTGVSCLMAAGQEWQPVPRVVKFGPPA